MAGQNFWNSAVAMSFTSKFSRQFMRLFDQIISFQFKYIFSNSLPQQLHAHLPCIRDFTALKEGVLLNSIWRMALARNCMANGKDLDRFFKSLATEQIGTRKKHRNGSGQWPKRRLTAAFGLKTQQLGKASLFEFLTKVFEGQLMLRIFAMNMKLYRDEERRAAEFHLENSIGEVLLGNGLKWKKRTKKKY